VSFQVHNPHGIFFIQLQDIGGQSINIANKRKIMMQSIFKRVHPDDLNENFFKVIGKDWMLITAGKPGDFNTMTASWGTTGILWNKPIAICFIRPHRYTFQFAERYDYYTLSFFDEKYRDILNYCGAHSGKNVDKTGQTGLKTLETSHGNVIFEQARLVLECRKLYADFLKQECFIDVLIEKKNYPSKDYHRFFIGEIEACYERL
jgi:flavin reductase (DIM6/NTAB) family NADH-FMN oxidoreductase RutF